MVDKENQWDDIEYTGDEAEYNDAEEQEEYSDEEYDSTEYEENDEEYSEEYEDGDEEYDEEYEDEEYEDDSQGKKGSAAPLIAILLIILLLAGAGYFTYTKFFSGTGTIAKTPAKTNNEAIHIENKENNDSSSQKNSSSKEMDTQDMGDFFFNEAGGNEGDMMSIDFNENGQVNVSEPQNTNAPISDEGMVVATVTEPPAVNENELSTDEILNEGGFNANEEDSNNAIMVSYNTEARLNPFKPPISDKSAEYDDVNESGFEIIEPPSTSIQDESLKRLLQTQISGIMYDEESPSAIVNLNGVDQFVKVGDEVFGYRIDEISKNKVQISYKNNSYVASVGELFTRGLLEKNPAVANFENKFAGKYRENN